MNILEKDGAGILVMELHGVVFFGSAERLANAIAAATEERDTRYVILDLRRVTDIDNSGSQILMEIHSDLAAQGKQLILSLARRSEAGEQLTDFGVLDAVGESRIFPDIDRAIEWAEDDLLKTKSSVDTSEQEMPLQQISILADLAPDEIAAIAAHLLRTVYPAGSAIFREGDPGADMFIVVKGTASAHIRQDDGGDIRLGTFAPGTVFGELAILDRGKRSATVLADKELVCHVLSEGAFSALSAQAPAVAIRLLANLGRELSGRLRHANQTIHQLEM
jgi:anti-anti-sigma regulatory factor